MFNARYILANCNSGQKKEGVKNGANVLFSELKARMGIDNVFDNLRENRKIYNTIDSRLFVNKSGYRRLYDSTKTLLDKEESVITLGGDHSISVSTTSAFFDKFLDDGVLIWIDAHADVNTTESSPSGNTHGMPVASTFGLMHNLVSQEYVPTFDQIIYLGLRDIDTWEREVLRNHKITYYTTKHIRDKSMIVVLDEINRIIDRKKNLHVSFDVDAMDPQIISATGTPVPGGFSMGDIERIIKAIPLYKVRCLDFVEYNPELEENCNSLENAVKILNMFI